MESSLKKIGLNGYEIRCYLTLLQHRSLKGSELSAKSGVPQGKIYNVLGSLMKKGLVSQCNTKPKEFKTIDPQITIAAILEKQKSDLFSAEKDIYKEIHEIAHAKKDMMLTSERVSIVQGREKAYSIAYHLYRQAQKSLDLMLTIEKMPTTAQRLLLEAKKRGVRIRILATVEVNPSLLNEIKGLGFDIRYYPVEELRILIKDKTECIEMIVNSKNLSDRTSIYIKSKELTKALTSYFDYLWKKSEPI